jgi:hypothetical protein
MIPGEGHCVQQAACGVGVFFEVVAGRNLQAELTQYNDLRSEVVPVFSQRGAHKHRLLAFDAYPCNRLFNNHFLLCGKAAVQDLGRGIKRPRRLDDGAVAVSVNAYGNPGCNCTC